MTKKRAQMLGLTKVSNNPVARVTVPLANVPVSLASDPRADDHDRGGLLDRAVVVVSAVVIVEVIVASEVVTKVEVIAEIEADIRVENAVAAQQCTQVGQTNDQGVRASVRVDPLIVMGVLEIAMEIAVDDLVRAADSLAIAREDQANDPVDQAFAVVAMTSAAVDVAMIA